MAASTLRPVLTHCERCDRPLPRPVRRAHPLIEPVAYCGDACRVLAASGDPWS